MMVVSSQYRSPLSFTADTFKSAANSLKRIEKLLRKLEALSSSTAVYREDNSFNVEELLELTMKGFEEGMADDLNTPRAFASLFKLVGDTEKALKKGDYVRTIVSYSYALHIVRKSSCVTDAPLFPFIIYHVHTCTFTYVHTYVRTHAHT